ncbi:hypothetical protein [Roseibium sp. TrichSKD4]|uniref:PDC sensor domain-containing protein n=1 Tax=Roseibium sp. TrichSKD4 TaxID=744980 RepID=UPI00143A1F1C|nr:hypothetical protein [Roseibium sp. TrichSKD4]
MLPAAQAQDVNFANAAAQVRTHTLINKLTAENVLVGADFALDTIGHAIKTTSNARVIHEQMAGMAHRLNGVRAILVLSKDGILQHDSYRFPVREIDLSDRPYFKASQKTSSLILGDISLGRTSGVPFLPLAKRVGEHTLVAIVSPHFLISQQTQCEDCVSAIIRPNGKVIASFPPATEIPLDILSLPVINRASEGIDRADFLHSDTAIAWKQSEAYPIIVMSARGLTGSARVGIYD